MDLQQTCINKLNYALDTSTTLYITKKLYGNKETLFSFGQDEEIFLNFNFGYENEILGKSLQGIFIIFKYPDTVG